MKPSKELMEHIDYQLRLMDEDEKPIGEKLSALDFQIALEAQKVYSSEGGYPVKSNITEPVFEFVDE